MSLSNQEVAATATRILADYDSAGTDPLFTGGFRINLDDAWRIQTAVTKLREARGEKVAGYKVGAVTPLNQSMMGLQQPVWADYGTRSYTAMV